MYSYSLERLEHARQPVVGFFVAVQRQVHVAVGEVGRQQVQALVVGALDLAVRVGLAAHELARRRP